MFHPRAAALGIVMLLTSIGCTSKPKLADREFVAKHLPQHITLDEEFRDGGPNSKVITTVEQKLAELGARVGDDGELYDRDGKRIFFFHGLNYRGAPVIWEREKEVDNRLRDLQRRGTVIEMAPIDPRE